MYGQRGQWVISCKWQTKRHSNISTLPSSLHKKVKQLHWFTDSLSSEIKWLGKFAIKALDDDERICEPGVNSTVNHQKHFQVAWVYFFLILVFFPPFVSWFCLHSQLCFFQMKTPPPHFCLKVMLLLHSKRLINQSIKKFFAVKLNQERSCRREKNRLN